MEHASYLDLDEAKEACSKDSACAMFYEAAFSTDDIFQGLEFYLCGFDAFEEPSYSISGIHTYIKRSKYSYYLSEMN